MSLKGFHVLITRPLHQAQALLKAVNGKGGQGTVFPVIEIKPVRQPEIWANQLVTLKRQADFFVFLSANAVVPAAAYLENSNVPVLAVGPGTEAALKQQGFSVKNRPGREYSAKGMLALPELQFVSGKQIVIFSGENGKPLLAETLKERGAHAFTLAVYRRECPVVEIESFLAIWQTQRVNMVISTSQEGLKNWSTLLGAVGQKYFRDIPLIVIHPAMKEMALKLKLGNPVLVARDATNESILEKLEEWAAAQK